MTMTQDIKQEFIEYCKNRIHHNGKLLMEAQKYPNIPMFYESVPYIEQRIAAYYDVIDDIEYDMACDTQQCCGEQNDCCTNSKDIV